MANEFVARKGIISLGGLTFPYYPTSVTYTASTDDYFIDVTNTGVTVHLPTVVGIEGKQYVIRNSSTGNTTIDAFSNQRIDGVQTQTLGTSNIMQIVSDGTDQWKISNVGGPVRNSTNNALLTSDGTIGGVDANSYLTFDGKTLTQIQQDSGATYSESVAYTMFNLTATTAYTQSQKVFSISNLNLVQLKCDFRLQRIPPTIAFKTGMVIMFPKVTSTTQTYPYTPVAAGTVQSLLYHSSTTTNTEVYVRIPSGTGSEVVNVDIACVALKVNTEG